MARASRILPTHHSYRNLEIRAILMEARRLAREQVRQRLKERGQKLYEFSFKQLCEQGEEYLAQHPDLIVELG
jgi:hypothetical protein